MKLKDITSKSVAAFVGTAEKPVDNLKHLQYFKYNEPWLSKIKNIILSFNGSYDVLDAFIEDDLAPIYKDNNFILLHSENIGPVFGAMENDRKIFEYTQDKDFEYVWKFSIDTIADSSLLDVDINTDNYDFFYINNVGFAAFNDKEFDQVYNEIISQEYLYPQTNYYIVKNKIKEWFPSKTKILELQKEYQEIKKDHPNYHPWDAIQDCDCEHMLTKTVKNNNLKPSNLLNEQDNKKILQIIHDHQIHDGSHKNIMYTNVGNLCHFHYLGHPAAEI